MAEYIERKAALDAAHKWCDPCGAAVEAVLSVPAADVAPVVYGRWVHLGGDEWCCSACGFVITTEGSWDKPTKKYCEDCGAKIDGGDGDAESVD
uniref:Zinc-ribbon family protein n=1 Tax=Siphoviridae sp. ct8WU9 TaxID=2825364 RepID=A0A8S5PTX1_9CAUD|nr:MAG TPA: zinc-ribbon family protein [Siphoviridae sp. ct8WU9]